MFVCVARLTLQIPESGSLKAKRQVLRRVTDRVKARFNVAVAEVEDNDLWQKAHVALAVVGNDRRHVRRADGQDHPLRRGDVRRAADRPRRRRSSPSATSCSPRARRRRDESDGGRGRLAEALSAEAHRARRRRTARWPRPRAWATGTRGTRRTPAPSRRGRARAERKLSLDEARAGPAALRNPRDWEKK